MPSALFVLATVLIRGPELYYGDPFNCANPAAKNWIVTVHPTTKAETVIFDQPIDGFCVFQQAQLSPDGSKLYLSIPTYATANTLAIVQLPAKTITQIPGVNFVYIIETGPHRGDLIYQKRVMKAHVTYPFFHARPNGQEIREISEEQDPDRAPILAEYLRSIGGTITFDGRKLP